MRGLTVLLLLPVTLALCSYPSQKNPLKTFEFGIDVGRLVFSKSGHIDYHEKVIGVQVKEPECKRLTYIRVDVNNPYDTPNVTFNPETKVVAIKYTNPLLDSSSTYTVTAKAVPKPYCGSTRYHPFH